MTAPKQPMCSTRNCAWFKGVGGGPAFDPTYVCDAFPLGIPQDIVDGLDLHEASRNGDGGITYKAVSSLRDKHMPGRHDQKRHDPTKYSKQDTVPYKNIAVDRAVYDVVVAMNNAGLETTHSCSGHVCDSPLETEISFFARGRSDDIHEFEQSLSDLRLDWELEHRSDMYGGQYSLHERRGYYGTGELMSSESVVSDAYADLQDIADWWIGSKLKHLPGRHDQKSHGRRQRSGSISTKPANNGRSAELSERCRAVIKECYKNSVLALPLVMTDEPAEYVEGYVIDTDIGFPFEHGWIETETEILDPTLIKLDDDLSRYVYVPASRFTYAEIMDEFDVDGMMLPITDMRSPNQQQAFLAAMEYLGADTSQFRFKHMPGRHDQKRHDPHKGAIGSYVRTKDWRGDEVEYKAMYGPFDDRRQAVMYGLDTMTFSENKDLLAIEDLDTGQYYLGSIATKRKAGNAVDEPDKWGTVGESGRPLNAYHATSMETVGAIQEQGIKAHASGHNVPAVYFTSDEESARVYGEAHGSNYAIVEFVVPDDMRGDVKFDTFDAERYGADKSYYIEHDVPPLWIKAIHVYEAPTERHMPRKVRTIKEASYYTVVVVMGDNGTELKHLPGRHDQKRHAPHKGGQTSNARYVDTYDDVHRATTGVMALHGGVGYYITPDNKLLDLNNESHVDALADPAFAEDLGITLDEAEQLRDPNRLRWARAVGPISDKAQKAGTIAVRETLDTINIDTAELDNSTLRRLQRLYDADKLGLPFNKTIEWASGTGERVGTRPEFMLDVNSIEELRRESLKHMPGRHDQQRHAPRTSARLPASQKVWMGEQLPKERRLSKLDTGELGEQVVAYVLEKELGTDFYAVNDGINNAPVDIVGDHVAVEVKAGLASNGRSAQHWRATIGQPGVEEQALLKEMSAEQKRAHNQRKMDAILTRKNRMVAEMSQELGARIKPLTMGVIISPDGSKADVFAVDGFHQRLGWNQYATEQYYVGTYDVGKIAGNG